MIQLLSNRDAIQEQQPPVYVLHPSPMIYTGADWSGMKCAVDAEKEREREKKPMATKIKLLTVNARGHLCMQSTTLRRQGKTAREDDPKPIYLTNQSWQFSVRVK